MSLPEYEEAKHRQLTAENGLYDEIDAAILRWEKEADLTFNQIVGVLEAHKMNMWRRSEEEPE